MAEIWKPQRGTRGSKSSMRSDSNSASGQGDQAFHYVAAELSGPRWDV